MLLFFIVALICSSVGFIRYVWFMSVGYGLAAAGIGFTLFILTIIHGNFNILFSILCILFMIYGIRLGGFLLFRELKNASYRKKLAEAGGSKKLKLPIKIILWISMSFMYICQCAGPIYRYLNQAENTLSLFIAILVCIVGIWMETVADNQKSESKKINPNMPAMEGLYKWCRCPNYFGEILFWTGSFISSFGVVHGAQWILVILGYVLIIGVMISGAKRVEKRHNQSYGDIKEYQEYSASTPLLIPHIK